MEGKRLSKNPRGGRVFHPLFLALSLLAAERRDSRARSRLFHIAK